MKKYETLVNEISEAMRRGELKQGDKIASVRDLSARYACSKGTVLRALEQLVKEQLLYAVPKSGHYVLSDISKQGEETDFKNSLPDLAQFPFGDFSTCLNQVLHSRDKYLFDNKPDERGLSDLLHSFYQTLPSYSVYTKKEQVFVTSGAQQALYILSTMDFHNERRVILLEQPGYDRMNKMVKELGIPYETVGRSPGEPDWKRLEELFAKGNIKFFYTVSLMHYPLGSSYREEEKMRLVDLASKYGVYIVEDDYMADFETGASLPLHYYDVSDRVIYLKSFSSIVFPSLRIALVVMPKALTEEFLKHKGLMDYDTNYLIQKAFSLYIDNGMFRKHRDRLVSIHAEKNAALRHVLQTHQLDDAIVYDTKAVFRIKEIAKVARLKKAIANRYKVDFLEDCYIGNCPYEYLKIDVRNLSLSEMNQKLSELLKILSRYIR